MNSIKTDIIFLIVFIAVVIGAFIVPQYIDSPKERDMQVGIEEIAEQDIVEIEMNETIINEQTALDVNNSSINKTTSDVK